MWKGSRGLREQPFSHQVMRGPFSPSLFLPPHFTSMASTATATRALYESLSAIGATWPKDRLRPDVSFGQSLIRAAERSLTASPPSGPPPPQTASSQGVTTRIDTKALDYRPLEQEETKMVEKAIRALSDIKSGQASKQVS